MPSPGPSWSVLKEPTPSDSGSTPTSSSSSSANDGGDRKHVRDEFKTPSPYGRLPPRKKQRLDAPVLDGQDERTPTTSNPPRWRRSPPLARPHVTPDKPRPRPRPAFQKPGSIGQVTNPSRRPVVSASKSSLSQTESASKTSRPTKRIPPRKKVTTSNRSSSDWSPPPASSLASPVSNSQPERRQEKTESPMLPRKRPGGDISKSVDVLEIDSSDGEGRLRKREEKLKKRRQLKRVSPPSDVIDLCSDEEESLDQRPISPPIFSRRDNTPGMTHTSENHDTAPPSPPHLKQEVALRRSALAQDLLPPPPLAPRLPCTPQIPEPVAVNTPKFFTSLLNLWHMHRAWKANRDATSSDATVECLPSEVASSSSSRPGSSPLSTPALSYGESSSASSSSSCPEPLPDSLPGRSNFPPPVVVASPPPIANLDAALKQECQVVDESVLKSTNVSDADEELDIDAYLASHPLLYPE